VLGVRVGVREGVRDTDTLVEMVVDLYYKKL
jgi:hypothetical protein